jgi:hypothetical protein
MGGSTAGFPAWVPPVPAGLPLRSGRFVRCREEMGAVSWWVGRREPAALADQGVAQVGFRSEPTITVLSPP